MKLIFTILPLFWILSVQAANPTHARAAKAQSSAQQTARSVSEDTGDIDMTQFQGVKPAQKGPKLNVNSTCETQDGSLLKKGDRGYKDCLEFKANRVMNQPHPPEAVPYEPRTD